MAPLAGPIADCSCHLRCLPPRAAEPVRQLGRSREFPRQPSLSGARLEPPPLDVDDAQGPLHSAHVDDLRPGLPAVGHESRRVSSDEPPPARRQCGGLLLPSPSDPDTGSTRSSGTRSRGPCCCRVCRPRVRNPSPARGIRCLGDGTAGCPLTALLLIY